MSVRVCVCACVCIKTRGRALRPRALVPKYYFQFWNVDFLMFFLETRGKESNGDLSICFWTKGFVRKTSGKNRILVFFGEKSLFSPCFKSRAVISCKKKYF